MNIFNQKHRKDNAGNDSLPETAPAKVIIYRGDLEYMSRCILDYPQIETGGNLFGFRTPSGIPVVQYVLGPGPRSIHQHTRFRQDMDFFNRNMDWLIRDHALHHIGTWHSHHELRLDSPSGGDADSLFDGMRADRLKSFLLVIGNCYRGKTTANAYRFWAASHHYQHCQWVVLDGESPLRIQFDKMHPDLTHVPQTGAARMGPIQSATLEGNRVETHKVSYPEGYWLNDKANNAELKKILEGLKSRYRKVSVYQLEDKTLQIAIQDIHCFDIVFPLDFPGTPPVIYYNDNKYENNRFDWGASGTVAEKFTNYIQSTAL